MKALYLLLIPLILVQDAGAQTPEKYNILWAGFGEFFPHDPGHDISASFLYSTRDVGSGIATRQTFNGELHGKFTKPTYMIDLLSAEFVLKRHSLNVGVGLFQEGGGDHGFYLRGGYRWILPIGGLLLKPGIDLYYVNGVDKMGSIDNRQKEISMFGFTASDQFTVEETDGDGYTSEYTYNADHLNVNYRRYSFLAEPKLALSTRPMGRVVVSLEGGWMFQVAQRSALQFQQQDRKLNTNIVGSVGLEQNGVLNGLYLALHVGVCIWGKRG